MSSPDLFSLRRLGGVSPVTTTEIVSGWVLAMLYETSKGPAL
jgi:hypothetical protein